MRVDLRVTEQEKMGHLIQQQIRLLRKKFHYILAVTVPRTDTIGRITSIPVVSAYYG
jgi:hypothetical protein